jgi:large subunit ribosomal protein L18
MSTCGARPARRLPQVQRKNFGLGIEKVKIAKHRKAAVRRKYHVRKKVFGTPERPRLSVFRSNRHIYAQIVDDTAGATLASASTRVKALREQLSNAGDKKAAETVGEIIAKQALGVGIKCVCFDRNRYKFHGRVKALAEAARKAGLAF